MKIPFQTIRTILACVVFLFFCFIFLAQAAQGPWLSDQERDQARYLEKILPHHHEAGHVILRQRFETEVRNERAIVSGFSGPEFWGSWTDGKTAVLKFDNVDAPQDKKLYLRVLVDGYLYPPKLENQIVNVLINDTKIDQWKFNKRGKHIRVSEIPLSALAANKPLHIVFAIEKPTRPKDVGENQDARQLGIGLTWLELVTK